MASEGLIVSGASYDADRLMKYNKPKVDSRGGKNVGVLNSESGKQTAISTPLMLTWGVNEWPSETGGPSKYDFALQFPSDEYSSAASNSFLENMKAFEEKLKNDAVKNCKEWFGKATMSREVIDALFSPMLRYPKNQETGEPDTTRSPTLKVKLPYWDGKFNCEIYDMNDNVLFPNEEDPSVTPQSLIQKGSNVAVIIQNSGVWFAGGKFGTTWKLVQCVVKPKATLRGKCHIKLDDAEKDKLEKQAVDDAEDENVTAETTNVDDSDDDDDDDEDDGKAMETPVAEPEPEPVPTAKKKRVVKKKKVAADDED